MSEEQLNALLERSADTGLQEKLNAAASPEAAEIAKDAGFSITAEDIRSMQSGHLEASDEELKGASGGRPGQAGATPNRGTWEALIGRTYKNVC